ncbi:MAG: hypothetical protein V4721_09060 [Bacteroidota bacterium]
MRILILSLLVIVCGCKNRTDKYNGFQKLPETLDAKPDSLRYLPPIEYMEFGDVRLNGKISLRCRLEDLYEVLGQPDSVYGTLDYCVTAFAQDTAYYAHFDDTVAEISKDSADVSSIDVRNGKARLVHPDFVLDRHTTLESLRKRFPKAVANAQTVNTIIGDALLINLNVSKEPGDFEWALLFQKGKLIRIDLNTPC